MKYKIYKFEDIYPRCKEMKALRVREKQRKDQDHSRWVFLDQKEELVYKLWNKTYIRHNCLPRALEGDFYDERLIPAFYGLIYDQEEACRGYIMRKCEKTQIKEAELKAIFEVVKENTKKTGLFAYDFCKENVMVYRNDKDSYQLTLIDLEGVYKVSDYKQKSDEHYNYLNISNNFIAFGEEYKELIHELLRTN
jgi:hypothetical protein